MGKVLCILSELNVLKDEFHHIFDTLKTLITDPVMSVEPKFCGKFNTDNVLNFIMFSNHTMSIKIESGDRRYMCIRANPKYAGNQEYFKKFDTIMNNKHAGDVIFTFLKKYERRELLPIPKTKLHKEMEAESMDSVCRYIRDITPDENGIVNYELKATPDKYDGNTIMSDFAYSNYLNYCAVNGDVPRSKVIFGRNISNLGVKTERKRIDKLRKTYYMLDYSLFDSIKVDDD
jgi:phage/plasmid-associated DNA primase